MSESKREGRERKREISILADHSYYFLRIRRIRLLHSESPPPPPPPHPNLKHPLPSIAQQPWDGCEVTGFLKLMCSPRRWRKREVIPNAKASPPEWLLSIKMGSNESHFSVSLIVWVTVTWKCPQTIHSEERGEQKRNWTEVLLLTKGENEL